MQFLTERRPVLFPVGLVELVFQGLPFLQGLANKLLKSRVIPVGVGNGREKRLDYESTGLFVRYSQVPELFGLDCNSFYDEEQ